MFIFVCEAHCRLRSDRVLSMVMEQEEHAALLVSLPECRPAQPQCDDVRFTVTEKGCVDLCVCSPVQNKSDHVFFTVMEKDDVLGHVKMPVTSLSTDKDISKTTLKAHRKCPLPHGDLLFQVGQEPCLTGNGSSMLNGLQKML